MDVCALARASGWERLGARGGDLAAMRDLGELSSGVKTSHTNMSLPHAKVKERCTQSQTPVISVPKCTVSMRTERAGGSSDVRQATDSSDRSVVSALFPSRQGGAATRSCSPAVEAKTLKLYDQVRCRAERP